MLTGRLPYLPLLLMTAIITAPALAHDTPLTYDRINLSASAGEEVENDTLVAMLYAQREGNDASQLAEQVNKLVKNAVSKAKRTDGVKVQTQGYNTNPIYRKQVLTGWRVRQSIRLESKDSAALSELIGDLQKELGVSNISYAVSPERRKEVEGKLISKGIAAFTQRAQQVTKDLGRQEYRLVEMHVSTSNAKYDPFRGGRGMVMMEKADVAAPPTLEAGTRRVEVSVSGTIEMAP
jgi:predicted secreted protein